MSVYFCHNRPFCECLALLFGLFVTSISLGIETQVGLKIRKLSEISVMKLFKLYTPEVFLF